MAPSARLTICLSFDVDTISLWLNSDDATTVSRGEFGAVAVPRLLDLFDRHGIPGTFFVPGVTAEVYPHLVESIVAGGHELGHHGWMHESPARLDAAEEEAVLVKGIEILERIGGVRPTGWRSPAWYTSAHSIRLLEEQGFGYDSSMMGHDVSPYWARVGDRWGTDIGWVRGEETSVVELPITWGLDDFPYFEYLPRRGGGLNPASVVEEIWAGDFDWAYENAPGGVLTYTMHPQVIGRGHRLLMLDRLIEHFAAHDGVVLSTMADAAAAWRAGQPGPS